MIKHDKKQNKNKQTENISEVISFSAQNVCITNVFSAMILWSRRHFSPTKNLRCFGAIQWEDSVAEDPVAGIPFIADRSLLMVLWVKERGCIWASLILSNIKVLRSNSTWTINSKVTLQSRFCAITEMYLLIHTLKYFLKTFGLS